MAADPLSMTASVIAVAGFAWTSSKALYDVVDGLVDAPQAISNIKNDLAAVQTVLKSLTQVLDDKESTTLDPILRQIGIDVALRGCSAVCDDFTATIAKYTTHSTETKFSKRDRLMVTFRKSKITTFTERLHVCKETINLALNSATLVTSTCNSDNSEHKLKDQEAVLNTHEKRLADIEKDMQDLALADVDEESDVIPITAKERDLTLTLIPELRKVCEGALLITVAKRTGQKFGKMTTIDRSHAGQGIVGKANLGVEQEFGDMVTERDSRAFQGQLDKDAFAVLMGSMSNSTSKV